MSISAVLPHSLGATSTSTKANPIANDANKSPDWTYLVPVIGILALGILLFPSSVPIGMAVGAATLIGSVAITLISTCLKLDVKDDKEENKNLSFSEKLAATVAAPILEEGFFRGILQPLAIRAIVFIVPAASAAFLGTGLSVAVLVSVVATAILFGLVHLTNDHKNTHIQAFSATKSGIVYGFLAVYLGLPAAIAAHMIHNTLIVTVTEIAKLFKNKTTSSSLQPRTV